MSEADDHPSRISILADSALAKIIRTVVVPILATALLWLASQIWGDVKANSAATSDGIAQLRSSMADVKQALAVQAAQFSDKAHQVDVNTDQINRVQQTLGNHEARIEVLESSPHRRTQP